MKDADKRADCGLGQQGLAVYCKAWLTPVRSGWGGGRWTGRLAGERHAGPKDRTAGSRADDVHRSAECADAVAQAVEAAVVRSWHRTSHSVVTYLDGAPLIVEMHPHRGGLCLRMLDHVGEGFGAEKVDARLDRGGEPLVRNIEFDRDWKLSGERVDCCGQTPLVQDCWMNTGDDLTQIIDPAFGVPQRQA